MQIKLSKTDLVLLGRHSYCEKSARKRALNPACKSFSVGIFQWDIASDDRRLKRSKVVIRVRGLSTNYDKLIDTVKDVIFNLDNGLPTQYTKTLTFNQYE